ncbi:hypothetical protein NPIL_613561 [Nephila pilipes]|uniref:Uncharacterized protein n=1 Tax=Nephila pilipes TaxID=299642 RepID=A0A8X6UNJ0_NEPPI|nr:hypothetical protein NPIL_613561 [Nephila pilipes]
MTHYTYNVNRIAPIIAGRKKTSRRCELAGRFPSRHPQEVDQASVGGPTRGCRGLCAIVGRDRFPQAEVAFAKVDPFHVTSPVARRVVLSLRRLQNTARVVRRRLLIKLMSLF